jgi:hypothetical protein
MANNGTLPIWLQHQSLLRQVRENKHNILSFDPVTRDLKILAW